MEKLNKYIHVGISPRGAQALITGAKVRALMDGRYAVSFRDIHDIAPSALRHRIIRSFEAEADGITSDAIIERLLDHLPHEPE